jgi:hypothetical protein
MRRTGDPARSQLMSLQSLADLRHQQAAALAYFDVFWLFAVLSLGLVLLVLTMKRSVAEKGEHIGAEQATHGDHMFRASSCGRQSCSRPKRPAQCPARDRPAPPRIVSHFSNTVFLPAPGPAMINNG